VGELPAKWAALSVFVSMKAALESVYGSSSFADRTIAIKGLGNVGLDLAKLITKEKGTVIAAEVNEKRAERAKKEVPLIGIVSSKEILDVNADIFAPCALGGDITDAYAESAPVKIVCGAANNQLQEENVADSLYEGGILYIPDYVANSGGLINVVDELNPSGYSRDRVRKKVVEVEKTVQELIAASRSKKVSTEAVAGEIARARIGI
jgi:leucine dehydrogenase